MEGDAELLRRSRAGDREAFGALVREHQARVFAVCAAWLSDPAEAEDAAQDCFVKAFLALDEFRGDSVFSTWLHRLATNHCLDRLRSRARRKTDSWDALLETEEARLESLLGRAPDPAAAAEVRDLAARLLALLPAEQRAALVLRETQGFSYQEIAAAMGVSVDSVKARLRRARETLLEKLRHFSGSGNV